MLIDIHSHLDMCKDIKKIIDNAKKNNVGIVLNCGVDIKSNKKTLELSENFKEVKAALGIYPADGLKLSESEIGSEIDFIKKNREKVKAIGEVGMDLHHIKLLGKQKEIFEKFIRLAKELNKPLIVHSRKAEEETVKLLERHNCKKVIMHCFSGNKELVKRIIKNKWFLSIPCIVKYSEHFQNIVKIAPIEQLFCETDSPFLHPDKKRNNEPSNIIEAYKKIAEIKSLSMKEAERSIEENYIRLFG